MNVKHHLWLYLKGYQKLCIDNIFCAHIFYWPDCVFWYHWLSIIHLSCVSTVSLINLRKKSRDKGTVNKLIGNADKWQNEIIFTWTIPAGNCREKQNEEKLKLVLSKSQVLRERQLFLGETFATWGWWIREDNIFEANENHPQCKLWCVSPARVQEQYLPEYY